LIRYAIATPLAALLLVLVLLLMAQLIQPSVTAKSPIDNLIPIDFLHAPQLNTPKKITSAPLKNEITPKEEIPQPTAPITKPLLLPQSTPIFEMDAISLPKAKFSQPTSLRDLVYDATPTQTIEQASPILPPTELLNELSPQFTENLFPLHTPPPMYPRRARKRGIEGWVKVSFTINTNGKVKDIMVLNSEPTGIFDHVTQNTISKWKFKPQLLDGKPTSRKVKKTIRFNLQQ